jgi:threonine synthase
MFLQCRECQADVDEALAYACPSCGGRLQAVSENTLRKERIVGGDTLHERYPGSLPSDGSLLGTEGETPLHRVERLATTLDTAADVYVKDERRNPTNSFKDRALGPTVSLASEEGADAVITASTGNGAAACAHYAARGGLDCYLLLDEKTPKEKVTEPLLYGAKALRVTDLFSLGRERFRNLLVDVADRLGAYLTVANQIFSPLPIEGVKTISYEVVRQLGWKAPDVVLTPVGGGDNLVAQYNGYREMKNAGFIDSLPRLVGVQAAGAAPLVEALDSGDAASVYIEPDTIASGINVPFTTADALAAVRETDGTAITVDDPSLIDGEHTLAAAEGIWAEPASTVVVPALQKLINDNAISPDETVVLTVTAAGHKNVTPVQERLSPLQTASLDPEAIVDGLDGLDATR